jgi:hypothetical protein
MEKQIKEIIDRANEAKSYQEFREIIAEIQALKRVHPDEFDKAVLFSRAILSKEKNEYYLRFMKEQEANINRRGGKQ